MKRVVVGVDGSKVSKVALAWAATLARPTSADVIAVIASGAFPHNDRVLDRWCAPVADAGVAIRHVVLPDAPPVALIETCDREDADLLVVGHHGRGRARQLGSVAMQIAHRATRPFAIVPSGVDPLAPKRFILGIDGSDAARAAALWVTPLARAVEVDVVGAYVPWPMPEGLASLTDDWWDRAQDRLDHHWIVPLRERLGPIGTVVVDARDPAAGLSSLADASTSDVIVIGTRRLGGLRPRRLGGVTMSLLHRADVPVIVVPDTR